MIDRLRDRDAFRRLRHDGRRVRGESLSLVVRVDPDRTRPAIGYAIPRRVGTAVIRNRLRRRLRELHRELHHERGLAPGDYLVLVRPEAARSDYSTLRGQLHELHRRAGTVTS